MMVSILRTALSSRLLTEQLLHAVRRAVRDVCDELAVEEELLTPHREHHQLAGFEIRQRGVTRALGESRRGGVEIEERVEQRGEAVLAGRPAVTDRPSVIRRRA